MCERVILTREVSPDGALTLIAERLVEPSGGPRVTLGFEGQGWHVHPEDLDFCTGLSPEQCALRIVTEVISGRMLIATHTAPGFHLVEIAGRLENGMDFLQPDETLTFRLWDGRPVPPEDIVGGHFRYTPLL